ncbi:RNA polymerase sigma-70 factor [Pedobacter endophyticus]|uniref:RNA polymerase sigma-70 factor n=1 Tax=Pedobacter endophyticus TaxID=2789740 RepID=A0A7U3SPH6_9SPHI|nr:RNA polymerase sigma-70 factor [Pedobacter endophyticus]QPH38513.1 RNA polymerase sigma-70 factor [Pedobacter endophyticus]
MDVLAITTGQDLIHIIEKGRPAVFTRFYTSYFQKLLLASDKYVKDVYVAEEVVQDVFLKIWEQPNRILAVRSIKSYLYKAVINASINYLNRQRNIGQHHLKLIAELSDDCVNDLEEENEIILLLHREIERLPVQCRKIFKLSRFEHLKYKEIAAELGISEKTVENHIGHALKTLRNRFMNDKQLHKKGKSFLFNSYLF